MPLSLIGRPQGINMAQTRIPDPEFWRWVDRLTKYYGTREIVSNAPWDKMRDALDFECFLLGVAWMTFVPSGAYIVPNSLLGQIAAMWPTKAQQAAAVLPQWWTKTPPPGPQVYHRPHVALIFCKMLDREHLNHFIWGAEYRLFKSRQRPTECWLPGVSYVLGCMKEPPESAQVTGLCDILEPTGRLAKKKGTLGRFVNGRTWIEILSGRDPLGDSRKIALFARYGLQVGALANPWVQSHYRYKLTYQLPMMNSHIIQRLSLRAVKDKIKALRKNKGDHAWLSRLWASYSILSEEDDEILALLPTILDANWASAVADMLDKRTIVIKAEANPPNSFRKLPMLLISSQKH